MGEAVTKQQDAPQMSRESRAMLLNVLWHHQGGSSPVGQPLRVLLGIEQHAHLTEEQVSEAKWIDGLLAAGARAQHPHPSTQSAPPAEAPDRALMEQALRALQSFPGFVERANPVHRERFNELLVAAIAGLSARLLEGQAK